MQRHEALDGLVETITERVLERVRADLAAANHERQYLGPREVFELTGISTITLQAWRDAGKGPPWTKAGRKVLYARRDLERWLADRRRGGR